jgi:hypothetical protein
MRLYVYCFTDPMTGCFDVPGVGDAEAEVRAVRLGELSVVVSEADQDFYDPVRRNILAHLRVLDAVGDSGRTVLPVAFGTLVEGSSPLRKFVKNHATEITRLLRELRGCVEMDVRVIWDTEAALRDIAAADPDVRALRKRLEGGVVGMEEQIQVGKLLEERMLRRRDDLASDMFGFLQAGARAAQQNDPPDDATVLNAVFLIARGSEPAFERKVEELDVRHGRMFSIKYSGPFHAHHFIQLRLA